VPAEATYDPGEGGWVLRQGAAGVDDLHTERRVWDRSGVLRERCLYGAGGALRQQDTYEAGRLWVSKRWADGEVVQSFFHRETDPPAVRVATSYRDGRDDRTTTFFDVEGRKLYSVRMEVPGPHHVRRYYNDRLVFEAIAPEDPARPPSKVAYYDLSGALLVSYASTGAGTGTWTLHDATGAAALTLPEDDERSRNEYNNWSCFLPGFASYDDSTTTDDPTCVREAFREAHEDEVLGAALERLEVSPELKAALGKGSWARVETAFGDGRELPKYVNGVLADDPALAEYALAEIWPQIEHQGSVYAATYRVATTLAKVLPSQSSRPAVERRVLGFLVEVLQLAEIRADRGAYTALTAALRLSLGRFEALAFGEDEALSRMGLYLLAHAGRGERAKKAAEKKLGATKRAAKMAATRKSGAKAAAEKTAEKKPGAKKPAAKRVKVSAVKKPGVKSSAAKTRAATKKLAKKKPTAKKTR
jgi:hypothetical protein